MSGYPLLLEGARIRALVVGGGRVAERKVRALIESGASVRVVAPHITPWLRALASEGQRLGLSARPYDRADIGDASLVIAATADRAVNAQVAVDALALARLVNVADLPEDGNCATVAAHHSGPLTIGVSAGGVPAAAARIRDVVGGRFDRRYAAALTALAALRHQLLAHGDEAAWTAAERALIGPDFCDAVEGGEFAGRAASWASERSMGSVAKPQGEGVVWD